MNRILAFCLLIFSSAVFASEPQCFKYEPTVVNLSGTIKKIVFPGPPNYEDIKKGDTPEPYWVLFIKKPICVVAAPDDEFNETESNVVSLQLIIDNYAPYKGFVGKNVVVTGKLTHAISGHHHTKVLIEVQNIKALPNKALQPTSALPRRLG